VKSLQGTPAEGILGFVADAGTDLTVMEINGRSGSDTPAARPSVWSAGATFPVLAVPAGEP
jgi:hypothetical protein